MIRMGRRIQKIVSTNSGSAWVVSYTNRFVYDGWNVVAILDGANNLLYTFTWGTDLSGTMQGAGGVGGLISMTVCSGDQCRDLLLLLRRQRERGGTGQRDERSHRRQLGIRPLRRTHPRHRPHGHRQPVPVLHQVLRLGNGPLLLRPQILQPLNRKMAKQGPN